MRFGMIVYGVVAFGLAAQSAFADEVRIPAFYQGAWSTRPEDCGKDSDANYFIDGEDISAWEVSWVPQHISSKNKGEIKIATIHKEYENQFPVNITIKIISDNRISFEECQQDDCWSVDLHRCH